MLNEKAHSEADLNINVEGVMQRGGSDSILSFFFSSFLASPPLLSLPDSISIFYFENFQTYWLGRMINTCTSCIEIHTLVYICHIYLLYPNICNIYNYM